MMNRGAFGIRLQITITMLLFITAATMVVLAVASTFDDSSSTAKLDQVEQELDSLPADRLHQLKRDRTDFEKLSDDKKDDLRGFHAQLINHESRGALNDVMHKYYKWLLTLAPLQQAELRDMPFDKRLEQIRRLMAEQDREWFTKAGQTEQTRLPENDVRLVYDWYQSTLRHNWDRINSLAIEHAEQGRYFGRTYTPSWELSESQRRRLEGLKVLSAKRLIDGMYQFDPELLTGIIPEQDIKLLRNIVSAPAKKIIDSSENQSLLVINWFQTAKELKDQQEIPQEKIDKFLLLLPTEERDRLNSYSPQDRDRIVRKRYYDRILSKR